MRIAAAEPYLVAKYIAVVYEGWLIIRIVRANLFELVDVFLHHADIDIVIPRDEPVS